MNCLRVGFCLLVALGTTGCPVLEELVFGEQEDADSGEQAPVDARRVDQKLELYAECHDSLASTIADSYSRYVDVAGEKEEPRRRRRRFIYAVTDGGFRICDTVLAEVAGREPESPRLDDHLVGFVKQGRRYAEVSQRFAPMLEAATGRKSPEEELHGALLDAYQKWREAADALSAAVAAHKSRNDPKLLSLLSDEGPGLEYYTRAVMVRADPMMRCVVEAADGVSCESQQRAFGQAADQFRAYYDANTESAERVFWMRTFASDLLEFRNSVAGKAGPARSGGSGRKQTAAWQTEYRVLLRDAATLDFHFP